MIAPQPTVKAKRGAPATVTLKVSLPAGFHMNSNTPTEPNLIPLTLKWTGGPLEGGVITYPKLETRNLRVYGWKTDLGSDRSVRGDHKVQVPAAAAAGPAATDRNPALSGLQRPHVLPAENNTGERNRQRRVTGQFSSGSAVDIVDDND